ncbi:MAG: hypothetical protein QXS96_07455 [Candidatus Caldarchaeum sp.]|jgi:hypothetical protein
MSSDKLRAFLDERIKQLEKELDILKQLRDLLREEGETGFDNLPWRQYRDGRGEWVFADQAPPDLVEKASAKGGVKIGEYVYEVTESGGKRFLRRRHLQASQQTTGA